MKKISIFVTMLMILKGGVLQFFILKEVMNVQG